MAKSLNININTGLALSKLSNSSYVTPVDGLTNTYNAQEGTQIGHFVGIGAEYALGPFTSQPFTLSLGLSVNYIDLGKISGIETPGSNLGLTDTLNYSMQANSIALMFEPRLIYTAYHVQPYFLTGAGSAFNTLNNFEEATPIGSYAVPGSPYSHHTTSGFAYDFGAGLQYPFRAKYANLLFRFEYRYLNLSTVKLGSALGQTTNHHLESNDISINIINVGLSYLFS